MYYDLFVPFPTPEVAASKKKKDKGKGKAAPAATGEEQVKSNDCWAGLSATERAEVGRTVALSGHLGYTVIAHTVTSPQSTNVIACPFGTPEARVLPYQSLDPRFAPGPSGELSQPSLVQVTRYHMRLDDAKAHPITAANTLTLRDYDILSVFVGSDKALQLACTDLSNPGPNQISIITVPLHERPYHFRLNRKQIRQAQRNGVVFEILYSAGLFPSRSVPPDAVRRYRQNFLTNARELVRVTGGRGIVFSSGPGGSPEGLRGPIDVVNLATILGVPANLAKEAMSLAPKQVLLRAQARRTYRAVLSAPRIVPPPGDAEDAPTDATHANGDVAMTQNSPAKAVKRGAGAAEAGSKKKLKA